MSINHVTLVGNLGDKPELRYTANGQAVCNFRVATNRFVGENKTKQTDWHTVVCFGPQAENHSKNLNKGSKVCVTGRINYRTWTAQDGTTKHATEIVAQEVEYVGAGAGRFTAPNGSSVVNNAQQYGEEEYATE